MSDLLFWLSSLLFLVSLLVIVIHQLMSLADLEFDYINSYDTSSKINKLVLPEFILQGALSFFYLLTGHWIMALLSLPYLYYNLRLYLLRKHLVDVTEILNLLQNEKKKRLFKVAHIAVFVFITTYGVIHSALEDHEHGRRS